MLNIKEETELNNLEDVVNRNKLKVSSEKIDIIVNTLIKNDIKVNFILHQRYRAGSPFLLAKRREGKNARFSSGISFRYCSSPKYMI